MKLSNEQIVRLYVPYIGQEVMYDGERDLILNGVKKSEKCLLVGGSWCMPDNYRLLLTPLSRISDKDFTSLVNILDNRITKESFEIKRHSTCIELVATYGFVRFYYDGRIFINGNLVDCFTTYKYLELKGYDVPVFIEPNHSKNGKTLIQLGIAIDKATL